MRRWLLGKDDPVVEGEFDVLTEEESHCVPGGQVLNLEGARSVYDLNRDRLETLKKAWRKPEAKELAGGAMDAAGVSAAPVWEEAAGSWEGCAVRRLVLWHAEGADVNQKILALSTYLGHAEIFYTYWYLTAVPELMAIAAGRFEQFADLAGDDDA